MRYYYIDSSALAKLYILERGTPQMQDIMRSARANPPTARALVSDLSSLEITSAILRKQRRREISRSVAEAALRRVESDFSPQPPPDASPFQLISFSPGVIQHGRELMTVHGLRTYDAVHLATALAARASVPFGIEFIFVGCDGDLCTAAAAEGIEIYDPAA